MTAPTLNVASREKAGVDLKKQRAAGFIPAVMYGHKDNPQMFWVKYLEFVKLYRTAGESTILELKTPDGKDANVLIQDVSRDPMSSRYTHIDFYKVRMDEEIETDVPLEFVGESEAVKALSGILVKSLDEVKIKCLPKDLPHSITVDISVLKTFDDAISVADLRLPKGVELLDPADTTIATVEPPRSDAEMAALEEKVEMDVTKVEGVVKEEAPAEGEAAAPAEASAEKKEA